MGMKDPLLQECFGEYGYGAGFLFIEGQSNRFGDNGESYCVVCPLAASCSEEFERQVELLNAEAPAVRAAVVKRVKVMANVLGSVEVPAGQPGFEPDPYQVAFVENVERGMHDRLNILD